MYLFVIVVYFCGQMSLQIIYETDSRKGTLQDLADKAVVRLGRHPNNDCVFDTQADVGVSAFHAEIHIVGEYPVIRDLESKNGLYINGTRERERTLASQDLVELGQGGPTFRVTYAPKQYGEKTVGMMIQQALARAGFRGSLKSTKYFEALVEKSIRKTTSRQKRMLALLLTILVGLGLGISYYLIKTQPQTVVLKPPSLTYEKSPDESIASANRFAIFMLIGRPNTNKDSAPGDLKGFCTAFAIASDLLATNAHCIHSAKNKYSDVAVVMNGQPSSRYAIIRMLSHPGYKLDSISPDVGLLHIKGRLTDTVKLATEDVLSRLAPGAPMFLYGFPGRLNRVDAPEATFVRGNIGRITAFDLKLGSFAENTLIQHSAFSSSGTSGSPIFTACGDAVGINAGGYAEDGETLSGDNLGVRIDMIHGLVSKMGDR